MRVFAVAGFTAYAGALCVGAALAPDRMPLHWGFGAEPDRLGTRARWLVESGLLGVTLLVLLAIGLLLAARAPVRHLNIPDKNHWSRPENTPRLRAMLAEDLTKVFGEIAFLLAVFQLGVVIQVRRGDLDLGWGHAVGLLLVVVILTGEALYAMQRRYMVPPAELTT